MTTTAATAWAARASAPVAMLHVGDSVTERTGAGSFEAGYVTKLLRSLQSDAGIPGGPGFVNSGSYVATDNSLSSFYNPVGAVQGAGFLGNRSGQFSVNQAVTFTFSGTSVSLHYFQFSGGQPMSVVIDGGAPTSVPTSNVTNNQRGVWTSPTLSTGAHTVVITPTSGQQLYLRGVHVYNGDEGKGVHGWEGGHFGTRAGDQASGAAAYFQDACAVIQPAVATLFLGLNDWSASYAAVSYQADLTAVVNAVNGYCTTPPSWVICGIYRRTDVTSTVPLADYTAAAQAVANLDPTNRRFVDLNSAGVTLSADGVHPNAAGHAAIAAAIRPAVLDLAGAPVVPSWPSLVAERWTGSAWAPLVAEKWNGASWVPVVLERAP